VSPPGGLAAKYQVPCLTHSNTPVLGTLTLVPLPVFSFRLVHGRRKKTGCRRRIVNKEDLAAEDRKRIRWSRELHPRAGAAAALPHTAHGRAWRGVVAGAPPHPPPRHQRRPSDTPPTLLWPESCSYSLSSAHPFHESEARSLPGRLTASVPQSICSPCLSRASSHPGPLTPH